MKRALITALAAVSGTASPLPAQNDVLKPFRPGGNNPPKEEPVRPREEPVRPFRARPEPPRLPKPEPKPEPEAVRPAVVEPAAPPAAPAVKPQPAPQPFKPGEPAPDANPVEYGTKPLAPGMKPADSPAPEPAAAGAAPTAEPVRPVVIEPAAPKPAAPLDAPVPKPVAPKPAAVPDMLEQPGDIVVRPNVAPTSPDQIQLRVADGFFARRLWRDAAPEYERYLTDFPRTPPDDRQAAYYHLAECYRQIGAFNNARANYEAVLANYGGGDYVGYAASRLGKMLYDEKDYRAALPVYRKASVRLRQPTLVNDASFFIGRCLEGIGQRTEARVQYESLSNIAESNPYRDASRLSVGRLYEESGQKENALKWLLPLGGDSSNPQIKVEALARAALLQIEAGKLEEAEKTSADALAQPEIGAWKEKLEYGLFRILALKKDYKGLIQRYESGAATGFAIENKLNVLVLVGEAHRELGNRDAAVAIYDQIAREYPTTPQSRDAAYARLVMLYESGDGRLLEEVNKFLTENPTAPQVERVSLMKAEALFKTGDYEHALPIYDIIVRQSKGLAGVHLGEATFKLGWCCMETQNYQKAIEVFGKFIRDHPTHPKLPSGLAQRGAALMQLKQYTAAQKDFEQLTTKFPKAKEREFGLENLALIYSQLGDQGRMADTFEILLRDFPETKAKPKANFWIGRAAFEAKDYKKAAPHLEKARELDPKQFFERASLAIMASYYNIEDLAATEKEIQHYRDNGGKAETPSDIIRWLAQEYYKRGDYEKAEKFFPELIMRKEAIDDDKLQLARARVKLGKFKDAVDSFDSYLANAKEPSLRVRAIIEKVDAQLSLKDWDGATQTIGEGLRLAVEGRFNGELRLRAAEIELGKGNTRKALQTYEAIPLTLEDEEVCPRALEKAIALHRQLGNEDQAKKLENQLRTKYPEFHQKKRLAKP